MSAELLVSLPLLLLFGVVVHDVFQRRQAILHNFPVIGHFRHWLEELGAPLRQYIVTRNDEERPFSRDQRRWVYASAGPSRVSTRGLFGFTMLPFQPGQTTCWCPTARSARSSWPARS